MKAGTRVIVAMAVVMLAWGCGLAYGIKAGDEAPDFTLEDQAGRPVTLSSHRGQKSVVLVFYRGYW
jgi:cytochrome oxidase Cu insertion factor (SCO1/SenC/PrrC family)